MVLEIIDFLSGKNMIQILIIEKESKRAEQIAAAFRELNYSTVCATDDKQAGDLLENSVFQLMVANLDCGAMELTSLLRDLGNNMPVIILAEGLTQKDKRRIFRCGADGYMPIPLDLEELQMRVKSLLWRCNVVDESTLKVGKCFLHSQSLTLETPNEDIQLRNMEFLLLEKLFSYPGRIFTRIQLMDELWGYDSQSDPRTVDTHIRRLRKKLKDVEDIRIQTIRGLGYRACVPRKIVRQERRNHVEDTV